MKMETNIHATPKQIRQQKKLPNKYNVLKLFGKNYNFLPKSFKWIKEAFKIYISAAHLFTLHA